MCPQGVILPEQLLNPGNQFHFFLSRQVLIFIDQELEFMLEALHDMSMRSIFLLVRQLGQFKHHLFGLVSVLNNLINDLRHHEEVIDLLTEEVLNT